MKASSATSALPKARNYCARQERCQQEVRDKLYAWEVPGKEIEPIISQLIGEGFLNEARFAEHYAVSKSRQKGWGLRKIEAALKQKQVSEPCIRAGLKAIDAEEQAKGLLKLAAKRWAMDTSPDPRVRRQRVFRYLIGKGYVGDAIERALSELRSDT